VLFAQREGVVVEDLGVCEPKNKARSSFWAAFRLEAKRGLRQPNFPGLCQT